MTEDEILKIKEHIEIHARREPQAVKITEILWKAVDELEHVNYWKTRCRDLAGRLRLFIGKDVYIDKLKKENERLNKHFVKRDTQLIKAKEIIKEMLSVLPKENIEGIYEITEIAEQFLKEL